MDLIYWTSVGQSRIPVYFYSIREGILPLLFLGILKLPPYGNPVLNQPVFPSDVESSVFFVTQTSRGQTTSVALLRQDSFPCLEMGVLPPPNASCLTLTLHPDLHWICDARICCCLRIASRSLWSIHMKLYRAKLGFVWICVIHVMCFFFFGCHGIHFYLTIKARWSNSCYFCAWFCQELVVFSIFGLESCNVLFGISGKPPLKWLVSWGLILVMLKKVKLFALRRIVLGSV